MPTIPIAARLHHKKNNSPRRRGLYRVGIIASTIISLFIVVLITMIAWLYASLTRDLPSLANLPMQIEPPDGIFLQPTRLYDRSGQHLLRTLQNPGSGERSFLSLPPALRRDQAWQVSAQDRKEIKAYLPAEIVDATLAINEPNFWNSPGFSVYGLISGSSPTLAQRLVKDLLLQDETHGLRRNLRERLLAAQLTSVYGRDKVLEWYLNSTQYGDLIYGVDSAAQVYFDKPADELTLAQAALIAAIDHAPALNPHNSPALAIERQQQTLKAMEKAGFISQQELDQALAEHLIFREVVTQPADPFYPFTELILDELYERLGAERLERGGLTIKTTLDYDLQIQVSCAASIQVARMEATQPEDIFPDLVDCEAARLLPTLPLDSYAEPGSLAAEVVVLDVRTGQILALAGDYSSNRYRLGQSIHPSGSIITPFIYLTAFTRGMGPASLVWDIPLETNEPSLTSDHSIYHGPVSLRTAFSNDYWSPVIQILRQVGSESVWRTSQQLGLTSLDVQEIEDLLRANQKFSGAGTSLLEIGHAYSVFANRGVLAGQVVDPDNGSHSLQPIKPLSVLEVMDIQGRRWMSCEEQTLNCSLQARPVVSPQLAYLVTDILSDEPARWASMGHPNALEIGRPAGAKPGRVEDGEQAWTAGFTPQITTVVWFGKPASAQHSLPDNVAASSASALWHAVVQYANRELSPQSWAMPPGISRIETCYPSGLLTTNNCPTVGVEIFLEGNEPTSQDDLYRVFQVNRETGLLATVFTPPELVENQVYLVVPPNAVEWAQASGLPTPPNTYDAVPASSTRQADIQISSPAMFSHVSGKVSIRGSAGGEGFEYYRIQIGRGLYPREWIQIGESRRSSVQDGILAEWDVQGLSGLYAVQLLVVTKDQEVKTSIIQVTVDNTPPEVLITRPIDKQRFIGEQDQIIILQASAQDEISLQKVEFYIDDRLVSTLMQPPYTVSWSAVPGTHSFLVKAHDLAQNTSEASLIFTVDR
jgi:membrane carboxypeptidase/penicillin-binding protein